MGMEYRRADLPIWVQGWLETDKALVFVAKKTESGPYLVDGNARKKRRLLNGPAAQSPPLNGSKSTSKQTSPRGMHSLQKTSTTFHHSFFMKRKLQV